MKLTLRMTLSFTGTLVVILVACLSFFFVQSSNRMTASIVDKTLVLVKTFESQLYTGAGKENDSGRNDVFTQAVQQIAKEMPSLHEINLYSVGLKKVVASNDDQQIGKDVDPEDLQAASSDKGVVLFGTEDGKRIIDVTEPLHYNGKIDYVIGIKNDVTAGFAEIDALVVTSIGLGLLGTLAGSIIIIFAARRIVRPLTRTGLLFRAMAEGDLTGRAEIHGKDEIAGLSRDYNAFTDQLETEVRRLKSVSETSRGLGESLAENSRQVDSGVGVIRKVVQELQDRLETLNQGVNSPEFSLGDIQEFLRSLLADLEDQSGSVNRSRSTTREMVEALRIISDETTQKLELAGEMAVLGRQGDEQMQATVQTMHQVARLSEGISGFIQIINDVADQTNLLAMNASIEAAHAGASGRGFAVVAGEIRKLSEATSSNAKNISASLDQMIDAVKKAEVNVSGTGTTIHRLTEGVENLSIAMTIVNSALQALAEETGSVTQAFDHLRGLTDGVLDRSSVLGTRLGRLEGAISNLVDVANQNAEGFDEISSKLDDLSQESGRLVAVIDDNESNVAVLEEVTGGFKTSES